MLQRAERLAKDLTKLTGQSTVKQIDKEIEQGNVLVMGQLVSAKEAPGEDGHVAELTVAKLTERYWTLFVKLLFAVIFSKSHL